MRIHRFSIVLGLALLVPACGGDPGGGDDGDDAPNVDGGNPDAEPPPEGFVEIIGRDWTVPTGTEQYKCVGVTVPEDMWISVFSTANPSGEHHAVVTVANAPGGPFSTQLGEYDCDVRRLDLQMLFASGVGTDDLALPDGVAIKVQAGQFLHLNLHLFNTTNAPISAHSAIYAKLVAQVAPENEAEMVFAGTFNINVEAGQTGTASGGCTFSAASTIFTYWPHMHQYATHQTVTMTIGGQTQVIHDQPFDFREQTNYPLSPMLQINSGDSINVECTYNNTSGTTLMWGDSSTEEMCFTGLYRYPKQAFTLFDCSEGGI